MNFAALCGCESTLVQSHQMPSFPVISFHFLPLLSMLHSFLSMCLFSCIHFLSCRIHFLACCSDFAFMLCAVLFASQYLSFCICFLSSSFHFTCISFHVPSLYIKHTCFQKVIYVQAGQMDIRPTVCFFSYCVIVFVLVLLPLLRPF